MRYIQYCLTESKTQKQQVNKQMFWDTNQKFKKKGSVLFLKSHGLLLDH